MEFQILKRLNIIIIAGFLGLLFISCEKEIQIDVPPTESQLVIEAYINDYNPLLNYCIISKTLDYFNPDLTLPAIQGAEVYVLEGEVIANDTIWDFGNKRKWTEIAPDYAPGLYTDFTTIGRPGKLYKIEIEAEGKKIEGITSIAKPVPIDSITFSYRLVNSAGQADTSAFMSVHFFEPVELGNAYQAMYRVVPDSFVLLWGDLGDGNFPFDDRFINGASRSLNYSRTLRVGERIHFFLNSIDRRAFVFWDSYNTVRSNGGPFATPAALKSTVSNAIGSFTGYGVSYKQLVVPVP